MNYYDETLVKIEDLIKEENYEEAKRLILNELEISYVPKEFEEKLYDLLSLINEKTFKILHLNIDDIEKYLFMDDLHQLQAVSELDKLNLRDHISLCDKYLKSNCNEAARAYLIQSLIIQQINHVFVCDKNGEKISFNPSNMSNIEETGGYRSCLNALSEVFMKEPSMLQIAHELLYKELLMALPEQLDENDGLLLADKIENYVREAFK